MTDIDLFPVARDLAVNYPAALRSGYVAEQSWIYIRMLGQRVRVCIDWEPEDMAAPVATREITCVCVGPFNWRGLDAEMHDNGCEIELTEHGGGIGEVIPADLFAQFENAAPA